MLSKAAISAPAFPDSPGAGLAFGGLSTDRRAVLLGKLGRALLGDAGCSTRAGSILNESIVY